MQFSFGKFTKMNEGERQMKIIFILFNPNNPKDLIKIAVYKL